MKSETRIWYRKCAEKFDEALPLGNGRIGAMVYGRPVNEVISLNEDSVWSGGHRDRNNPDAYEGLCEIRKLIDEGNLRKAEETAFQKMQGICSDSRSYVPLGNLFIHMDTPGKPRNYVRELSLETAVNTTVYTINDIEYRRKVFISAPDNVLVVRFECEKKGGISFSAYLDGRDGFYDDNRPAKKNIIMYTGGTGGKSGIDFAAFFSAKQSGGSMRTVGSKIIVENADSAEIMLSCKTDFYMDSYKSSAMMDLECALECSYEELLSRHIDDYSELFKRTDFKLPETEEERAALPTDERLAALHGNDFDDKECIGNIFDPGMVTLLFNYGKYIIISASRCGTQPMNQQGIWNEDMKPKWGSRYIINISFEMCYWAPEILNLPGCHMPLFDLLERIHKNGSVTAHEMYHCRGYACHHNTDIWGDTAPQDMYAGATIWPMGAAWLALHIFEHYLFTGDKAFLEEKYQLLKDAALFFVDYLVEDEKGRLITNPSVSPENSYKTENGSTGSICKGASMDSQIITALFRDVCESCKILDKDKDFANELQEMLKKIPQPKVGKYGQIQEWAEDYDEVDVGHRHVSQLFGLYPENFISLHKTPKLANAARATLIRRLVYEDGHFGWSYAWNMNMWARLGDGQMAYENLQKLFLYTLTPNLLNSYPPLQIDGNLGAVAGICECLMQSVGGEINLLPALPANWKDGEISGICARGGFIVSIKWSDGKLDSAKIVSTLGNRCRVCCKDSFSVTTENEESVDAVAEDGAVAFDTKPGVEYFIK